MTEQQNLDLAEQRIRERIERTRARMGSTIEEIGAHLNPEHLKREFMTGMREQVEHTKREIRSATIGRAETLMHNVEETVNQTRHTLFDTIRDNPVPAAMAGIGLGWLIADVRRHQTDSEGRAYPGERFRGGMASTEPGYMSTSGYTAGPMTPAERMQSGAARMSQTVREGAENATERARHAASDVAEQTQDAAERVQETISGAARQVQQTSSQLVDQVQHASDEAWHRAQGQVRRAQGMAQANPLAAGAVALALGFAAGMVLPDTAQEDRWMGTTRDRMMDRAEAAARRMGEKVERVAERTAEELTETAQREASREGLMGVSGDSPSPMS